MSVIADYTTPDIIQEIQDIGAVALAFSGIAAVVVGIAKAAIWMDKRQEDKFAERVLAIVKPAIKEIVVSSVKEATAQIQPEANGGLSLPDLARNINKVMEALGIPQDEEVHINAE